MDVWQYRVFVQLAEQKYILSERIENLNSLIQDSGYPLKDHEELNLLLPHILQYMVSRLVSSNKNSLPVYTPQPTHLAKDKSLLARY
jgi:hypothetical protein